MDIAATGTALSQAKLANDIDYAVAGKTLDSEKQQGAAVIAMLEKSAIPPATDPTGQTGSQFDAVA